MNVSITLPLDDILRSLQSLSLDNRKWLAEHLTEQVREEECKSNTKEESFFNEFVSIPYDNPITANEENKMIRDSHYFDPNRDI